MHPQIVSHVGYLFFGASSLRFRMSDWDLRREHLVEKDAGLDLEFTQGVIVIEFGQNLNLLIARSCEIEFRLEEWSSHA